MLVRIILPLVRARENLMLAKTQLEEGYVRVLNSQMSQSLQRP
jgi:hypothetical protein